MEQTPYLIVLWGDSIAASGWSTGAEFSYNVCLNVGRPIKIINEGVGGMPAATARTQFDSRVAKHKPDLVIIQFGFNDIRHDGSRGALPLSTPDEFAEHLTDMVRRCRDECRAKVVLFGNHRARRPNVMPTGLTYDDSRQKYNHIAQSVARKMGVHYVDMSEAILTPDVPWYLNVCEDGVHLSELGKTAYACAASSVIGKIIRGESV